MKRVSESQVKHVASLLNEDADIINESGVRLEMGSIKRRNVPLLDTVGPRDPRQVLGDVQFDFDYQINGRGSPRTFNEPGEAPEIEIVGVTPTILSAKNGNGQTINVNGRGMEQYEIAAQSYFMNHLIGLAEQHVTDQMNDHSGY